MLAQNKNEAPNQNKILKVPVLLEGLGSKKVLSFLKRSINHNVEYKKNLPKLKNLIKISWKIFMCSVKDKAINLVTQNKDSHKLVINIR